MRIARIGAVLGMTGVLLAAAANAGTVRRHEAHLHGRSQLDLALQGDQLLATLTAPGADLVGFEHAPKNDAETASIRKAVEALRDASKILGLPAAAACVADDVDVTSDMLPEADADHGDADHDAGPDSGHDHQHAADHANNDHDDHEGHADFRVTYRLTCVRPDKLDGLNVGFFTAFPGAQELIVQAVGPWGQTSRTLTRASPRLSF